MDGWIGLFDWTETCQALKAHLARAFIMEFPACVKECYAYCEEAMDTETLLRTRLQAMPSADFEGLLHPIFEQDEWKLIALGGLLGCLVGIFQSLVVFDTLNHCQAFGMETFASASPPAVNFSIPME